MKNKILKVVGGFVVVFIFVFTLFYSTNSYASYENPCRWNEIQDPGPNYDYFCGFESDPLHCNCGDMV